VVPPRHDGLVGPNVIPTRGALHRVTAAKLSEHAVRHAALLQDLPRPLVAVLVGGSSRHGRFTLEDATRVGGQLAALARDTGAGLAVTPSRRTGEENVAALRATLTGVPHFFWDGSGENPYFGLLGLADHIVVTGDSASMVSEACSTGKPVYVIELQGYGGRLRVFHQELRREGVTRPFDGRLAHWNYEPVNDTPEVAARLRSWLGLPNP
jgi:mitochondrial fission protein ELM1